MLYVIHARDAVDAAPKRAAHYPAHKAFLNDAQQFGVTIIMSGPLVADEGETRVGSHFVLEAPSRKEIEAFHHADPFFKAGVWSEVFITAFIKTIG